MSVSIMYNNGLVICGIQCKRSHTTSHTYLFINIVWTCIYVRTYTYVDVVMLQLNYCYVQYLFVHNHTYSVIKLVYLSF